MEESIWNDYLDWLLEYVNFKKKGYHRLMKYLHDIEFEWIINRDQNRAEDGLNVRRIFIEETFDRSVSLIFNEPCTVLEMLIALANRIENEYIGDPNNPHPEDIFWEILCNLGLDEYYDKVFDVFEVDRILEKWMHRDFNFDGYGSIFPLNDAEFDQRDIEIWSQMNQYLMENY